MNQPTIKENPDHWDIVISPRRHLLDIDFKELWRYRDLWWLFVRRDFVAAYKQTILGPLWHFIRPILTTIVFTVIFGRVAGIPTDGIPPFAFYLAGITNWNYFAACMTGTSNTFVANKGMFGKVYFPRLITPLSVVTSNLIKYGIQLLLFIGVWIFFMIKGAAIEPNWALALFPLLVLNLAGLGLGFGLVISSMTTKYRDLTFLVSFGVQLLMYATPVIYPLSEVPEHYQAYAVLNPMTSLIETFKYGFLGKGTFEWAYLGYSFGFMVVLLFIGVLVFNKTEQNFMDTV
jgi:lipopolysaccharide transport system permease protein